MKIKKLKLGFVLPILSLLIIISCRKERIDFESKKIELGDSPSLPVYYNLPIILNPHPLVDYIDNPDDLDDQKISENLLKIAYAARNVFIDSRFNQEVFNAASYNDNLCKDLRDFVNSNDLRSQSPNLSYFDSFKNLVLSADLTRTVNNLDTNGIFESTDEEQYIPAIFFVNKDIADLSKQPILSSGIFVNSELSGMSNYENYIVAWIKDSLGGYKEILINEEMALNTPNPIFIIDNAENEITHRPKQVFHEPLFDNESNLPERRNMNTVRYSIHEYRINHRYERFAASEFWVSGAQIDNQGIVRLICFKSNGNFDTDKSIKNVSKNDVGKQLATWELLCKNSVTPFASNFIFWNTFERDWSKSRKDLGSASRNGIPVHLSGNRTYSGEWYTYRPGLVDSNPLDLSHIYWVWSKWHTFHDGKGVLAVHRT